MLNQISNTTWGVRQDLETPIPLPSQMVLLNLAQQSKGPQESLTYIAWEQYIILNDLQYMKDCYRVSFLLFPLRMYE